MLFVYFCVNLTTLLLATEYLKVAENKVLFSLVSRQNPRSNISMNESALLSNVKRTLDQHHRNTLPVIDQKTWEQSFSLLVHCFPIPNITNQNWWYLECMILSIIKYYFCRFYRDNIHNHKCIYNKLHITQDDDWAGDLLAMFYPGYRGNDMDSSVY